MVKDAFWLDAKGYDENNKELDFNTLLEQILDAVKSDFPGVIFPDDAGIEYFETAKTELAAIQTWFLKHFGEP